MFSNLYLVLKFYAKLFFFRHSFQHFIPQLVHSQYIFQKPRMVHYFIQGNPLILVKSKHAIDEVNEILREKTGSDFVFFDEFVPKLVRVVFDKEFIVGVIFIRTIFIWVLASDHLKQSDPCFENIA